MKMWSLVDIETFLWRVNLVGKTMSFYSADKDSRFLRYVIFYLFNIASLSAKASV
jgi:hypothetical protein